MVPMLYNGNRQRSDKERYERAVEILEAVGLGERIEHRPNELSGGQQQRVAIARALVNEPSILLADEPTGNLDTRSGQEIMEVLDRLHSRGATIVMVTHEVDIAQHAERVIYLLDGKIASDGVHASGIAALHQEGPQGEALGQYADSVEGGVKE
jgi:putative ABC transport system ATP-binding protein